MPAAKAALAAFEESNKKAWAAATAHASRSIGRAAPRASIHPVRIHPQHRSHGVIMSVTLAQASTIVDVALKKARETNLQPLTVAVLDAGGISSFQTRGQIAHLRFDIASAKPGARSAWDSDRARWRAARRRLRNSSPCSRASAAHGQQSGRRADPRRRRRYRRRLRHFRRRLR